MTMTTAPKSLFSAEEFRRRAARQQGPAGAEDYGDHSLNPDLREMIVRPGLRDAAVLIPVVDHADGASVILTQRTLALRNHSGQIAFPGGRIDPEDVSPEAAALREADEEIGLRPRIVDVVGRMPDYSTGSGYRIAPVLGIVRPGFRLHLNPDEVDAAFEVPLAFLMDPANHRRESRLWQEKERFYYTMPFGERFIWGVTAGIIRTLYERLYA
ncbi:CoA pyrophosphatase [Nitratireductor aquimarinus]|uniref:CoA pyrophosphatase n=1 Tax=Nitratireductor aquimarinus TaxID=889300 RepID=A0ABU4AG34_9HYPH|nr:MULTISPECIES: CoA pyrophosphatase [Alphaproteobacteria]MBY6022422.1 CoA pyrophosphatase [Nitratireductor sp. DP7N14-4]MBN7757631.1 CoA pyrophosphatase [Nitratireductor aquimarinus]MBN7775022.1 CoA pyrophosphatase [Nitratireductor pacificus]MBN7779883.1 CoA pyrophosphatase [Nitratireductor pacificus]MBN7788690.1 CoA pyrophosphatase [Nitratireductor aquimarinus]